jgi:putative nucleotidyltransferase-like protein
MIAASRQTVESQPAEVPIAAPRTSPEFDVLLACCRNPAPDSDELRRALSREVDGKRLVQLAEHHGVVPRVYPSLSASALLSLEVRETLRQRYEANARKALWLTRELGRVLGHLDSRGIAALPYKGPVLAESLYGNVALRQFSDLDVLIHAADVPRAKAALVELGYTPGLDLTPQEERAYLASGYEYTFDSAQGRNLLELQWQILPRFYSVDFAVDGLFDGAQSVTVAGRSLQTLNTEDLMLVLCVHAAKHAWVQLSWLCDIAQLARSQRVKWDAVTQQAKRLGIERIVAVSLVLGHKLLGMAPPEQAQIRAADEAIACAIVPIIAEGAEYDSESISYFRLMMRLRERRRDRLRFLWRLAVTPSVGEWSAVHLPGPLFFLYRVVRVFRLAARVLRRARPG